jgi:hypothetical protein
MLPFHANSGYHPDFGWCIEEGILTHFESTPLRGNLDACQRTVDPAQERPS